MSSSAPDILCEESRTPERLQALVIGYGNELRGDDGVGPAVARIIQTREIPGVTVVICHQLLPEHAAEIATAGLVIFVDATMEGVEEISVRRVHPSIHPECCGHQCAPEKLLYWCQHLASRVPHAWFIRIPASDFGFGENLSPTSAHHVENGVCAILRILEGYAQPLPAA